MAQLATKRGVTRVQVTGEPAPDKPWLIVGNGDDNTEEITVPITVDVTPDDLEFAKRYASYRNALAKVQGKKLRTQWSRKLMVQSWIAGGAKAQREALAEMVEACGPLPSGETKDRAEMEKYARRVLAWDKKRSDSDKKK